MTQGAERLGIVVVGAGFLGAQRARAARAARSTRLVGVCDRDAAVARRVAAVCGVRPSPQFEEALHAPEADALVIATPHADHVSQVQAALEAGKHVLCEKPLAVDPGDARALCHLADERGLVLATGFNHRFLRPVRDALGLARGGELGTIETVRVTIGHRARPAFLQSWHTDPARSGGGTFIDNGPHACDLVRLLLGDFEAASGTLRPLDGGRAECEVEAFALLRTRNRRVAELRSSWVLEAGYLTLEIRGTEGHLFVDTAPWRLEGVLAGRRRCCRTYLVQRLHARLGQALLGCDATLVAELDEFAAAVRGAPAQLAAGWDGCAAAEMVAAVYRASRLGREVALRSVRRPLVYRNDAEFPEDLPWAGVACRS